MKALPIALATAVGVEFATPRLYEALPENPHTELEIVQPARRISAAVQSGSSGSGEPLSRFRWKVFYAAMLRAKRQNKFDMHEAFLTTARALIQDRKLLDWERVMQYNMLKHEMKMLHLRMRGRVNCFGVLPAIAAALRVHHQISK